MSVKLGKEGVKHILLCCSETIKCGAEYLSEIWLSMKGERACKEDTGSSRWLRLPYFKTIGT